MAQCVIAMKVRGVHYTTGQNSTAVGKGVNGRHYRDCRTESTGRGATATEAGVMAPAAALVRIECTN
eukprot:m.24091 g.24091  ORF g.24091 m.24091 type:complete len:67 (+) comp11136_c0_seq1:48-248(+)